MTGGRPFRVSGLQLHSLVPLALDEQGTEGKAGSEEQAVNNSTDSRSKQLHEHEGHVNLLIVVVRAILRDIHSVRRSLHKDTSDFTTRGVAGEDHEKPDRHED